MLNQQEDLQSRDVFVILEQDYGIPLGHADLAIDAAQTHVLTDLKIAQAGANVPLTLT